MNSVLPIIIVYVDGTHHGYSHSILNAKLYQSWSKQSMAGTTLIRTTLACCRSGTIRIHMATGNAITIDVLDMQGKPLGFDLLLGTDPIKALSNFHITHYGSMKFEETKPICAAICISTANLSAKFD